MNIVAVVLNFFLPGVGSLVAGHGGVGVAQLLIFLVGVLLVITVLMLPFGIILMAVAWIWGLISAATATNIPQHVVVVDKRD